MQSGKIISACAFAIIVALVVVVGLVSDGVVRHIVQTAPVWIVVVVGWRGASLTKWIALPIFLFWLVIMVLIWLFLLGLSHILHGHFTIAEIAMTIVVGLASLVGIVVSLRTRSQTGAALALVCFVLAGAIQFGFMELSSNPNLSHDTAFLAWIGH